MLKRKMTMRTRYQLIAAGILAVILIIHFIWPTFTVDNVALALILGMIFILFGPVLFKSMTLPWNLGAVEFQEDKDLQAEAKTKAKEAIKQIPTLQQSSIGWNKVATLFWLGNDLMWIQDMIYRDAQPERMLQGIKHALDYLEELGFASDSLAIQELSEAKKTLQMLADISPSTQVGIAAKWHYYLGVQKNVETVKWYIHSLASMQQPDFKKLRAL